MPDTNEEIFLSMFATWWKWSIAGLKIIMIGNVKSAFFLKGSELRPVAGGVSWPRSRSWLPPCGATLHQFYWIRWKTSNQGELLSHTGKPFSLQLKNGKRKLLDDNSLASFRPDRGFLFLANFIWKDNVAQRGCEWEKFVQRFKRDHSIIRMIFYFNQNWH